MTRKIFSVKRIFFFHYSIGVFSSVSSVFGRMGVNEKPILINQCSAQMAVQLRWITTPDGFTFEIEILSGNFLDYIHIERV